jgi:hypothetical protein
MATDKHDLQPTQETHNLIRNWAGSVQRYENLTRQLDQTNKDVTLTAAALGAHMIPKDAKEGETFHIWYGDGLLGVTYHPGRTAQYTVFWRKRPREI